MSDNEKKREQESTPGFPRDRDGVPFEDDFTEDRNPSPAEREAAGATGFGDPDTDSQAADDFMTDRKFPKPRPS